MLDPCFLPNQVPQGWTIEGYHLPILNADKELEISSYEMWKDNWLNFFHITQMPDSYGLSFLKEQSIPVQKLKDLIAVGDSVESAFALLDT